MWEQVCLIWCMHQKCNQLKDTSEFLKCFCISLYLLLRGLLGWDWSCKAAWRACGPACGTSLPPKNIFLSFLWLPSVLCNSFSWVCVLPICFSNRLMRSAFVPGWGFYVSNNVALGRDVQDLLWEISSDDLTALFSLFCGAPWTPTICPEGIFFTNPYYHSVTKYAAAQEHKNLLSFIALQTPSIGLAPESW